MLRRSSVIHVRQRLYWDTCPVDTVRGDWCITTSGVKANSAYNKKTSSRQSLMHGASLSHRCKGEEARRKVAEESAPSRCQCGSIVRAKLTAFPTDPASQPRLHQICYHAKC